MHAFLSSSMAVVLLIHAAFGCCWHHAHYCVPHQASIAVAEPTGCCQHRHHGDSEQREQPCGCKVECHGTCAYVLPQKVKIDAPQAVAFIDLVATLPLLADAQTLSASWCSIGDGPLAAAPPLRLHLLHQLLLN